MWGKYKQHKKEALKLWNTYKKNGKRMYNKKEIAQMLKVDEETIKRWLELPIDNAKTKA